MCSIRHKSGFHLMFTSIHTQWKVIHAFSWWSHLVRTVRLGGTKWMVDWTCPTSHICYCLLSTSWNVVPHETLTYSWANLHKPWNHNGFFSGWSILKVYMRVCLFSAFSCLFYTIFNHFLTLNSARKNRLTGILPKASKKGLREQPNADSRTRQQEVPVWSRKLFIRPASTLLFSFVYSLLVNQQFNSKGVWFESRLVFPPRRLSLSCRRFCLQQI